MAASEGQLQERQGQRSPARFTGRFAGKLDAKFRVVVPTEFRQRLEAAEVYAFASMVEEGLQLGPASLIDDLLDAVTGLDVYDEERWALEEEIIAGVIRLPIDETGRVSLPKELREHAKLSGPVMFAGRGQHFVLADAALIEAKQRAAREAAEKNRDTLRARMLPSVAARRRA